MQLFRYVINPGRIDVRAKISVSIFFKNIIEIFPDGIKNSTLVLDNDIKKFVKTLGNINDHNNSLKILEILYKLSKNPDTETDDEIVSEYKELKSHFKSLRKEEFRKIKK